MIKYIILVLLLFVTIINIYSITLGKKKKNYNELLVNNLKMLIEKRYIEIVNTIGFIESKRYFFVSDCNKGFLLAFDSTNHIFIIITETNYNIFKSNEVHFCNKSISKEGKYLLQSKAVISTESDNVEIIFGSKKRKSSSILGKFIIDSTTHFSKLINDFIKE